MKFLVVENLFSTCFSTKSSRFPKAASLGAHRSERKTLSLGAFSGVRKELCSVAAGNFAQSFMGKKSKLLIESRLQAESDLKNYPVDDFWRLESAPFSICTVACRCALTCGSLWPTSCPERFYIFLLCVTGVSPPYPHELFEKSSTKNFFILYPLETTKERAIYESS